MEALRARLAARDALEEELEVLREELAHVRACSRSRSRAG
jgi:hypothetical protein